MNRNFLAVLKLNFAIYDVKLNFLAKITVCIIFTDIGRLNGNWFESPSWYVGSSEMILNSRGYGSKMVIIANHLK